MAWAYYNEVDMDMAAWLRELIKGGQIAPGEVDERSIEDVAPADIVGFRQCHFFAGIGVWSYALRRAGWPDNRPVWTGSCPCQPFSQAGGKRGFDDARHLWPHFNRLIAECRPAVVFGEQVASKDADAWIDTVQADLEAMEYAVGAVPFPAAGVGAPNRRDRLYWVADAPGREEWWLRQRSQGKTGEVGGRRTANERPWDHVEWIECDDGRSRPVEPGTPTLAAGTAARVERLRGYGNGLNAEAATIFIESYIEAVEEMSAAA